MPQTVRFWRSDPLKVADQEGAYRREPMPHTVRDWMSMPVVVVDPDFERFVCGHVDAPP